MAIKGAYKTVKAIKPGFVTGVIDALLDEWIEKLEPYYIQHQKRKSGSFGSYVKSRAKEVADRLLEVTDLRAEGTTHSAAAKLYHRLRPAAQKHVASAVPGLGQTVDKFLIVDDD